MAMDAVGFTRLMEADEAGTLARLTAARKDVIEAHIAEYRGRVVKATGDGFLAEFASAVDCVECAAAVQADMAARNARLADRQRLRFRIGLNLGDVIVEDGDIYGDGVNIAARLEQIAEPEETFLSAALYEQVRGKTALAFSDLGPRQLKNHVEPVRAYRVERSAPQPAADGGTQQIRFCRSPDGTTIAYATFGSGPPIVKLANWLNHLEYDWISPIWRPIFAELARGRLLVRYDQRGNGLSDWEVENYSLEAMVQDIETVVDAAGLDRFALFGLSQGAVAEVAYAVRHPERVTRLVFLGGFVQGFRVRGDADEIKKREAMLALMDAGWGSDNPAFHQMFASIFVPDGNPEQIAWWMDLQRKCTSPKSAFRLQESFSRYDVRELLPRVTAPTIVFHSRSEIVAPFDQGRLIASQIPGARFVALESRNHIILEHEPAWPRFTDELRRFLADSP